MTLCHPPTTIFGKILQDNVQIFSCCPFRSSRASVCFFSDQVTIQVAIRLQEKKAMFFQLVETRPGAPPASDVRAAAAGLCRPPYGLSGGPGRPRGSLFDPGKIGERM